MMKNNMIIFHFPLSLLFLYCSIVRFNCQLSHCFSKLTMIYGIMVNDLLNRPPPPHTTTIHFCLVRSVSKIMLLGQLTSLSFPLAF